MIPDFSKSTIETIAKRSAYKCANPNCRVNTVGPNSDPQKSTKIGEASHIFGARLGSNRYNPKMSDTARSEITNAIWLCRNCHKLIDTDEIKYSSNILFKWREKHEEFIASSLGKETDQIAYEQQLSELQEFVGYPPIIRRIIVDKPDCWEYRLTAELMRFLNEPLFRKLEDLKQGLYLKSIENVNSDRAFDWLHDRVIESSRMMAPAGELLNQLTESWGQNGESGDVNKIHHVVKLFKKYLESVIAYEERVRFAVVPKEYRKAVSLLENLIGSQVLKLSNIPEYLDSMVLGILEPDSESEIQTENGTQIIKHKVFVFEHPPNWEKEFNRELKKLGRIQGDSNFNHSNSLGCMISLVFIIVISFILILL